MKNCMLWVNFHGKNNKCQVMLQGLFSFSTCLLVTSLKPPLANGVLDLLQLEHRSIKF